MSGPRLLIDSVPIKLQVVESSAKDGRMVVRGEYAFCGRATQNKRKYTEELMGRELGKLGEALSEKKVFGELDHPADGRTQLHRTSHIVTSLNIDDQGRVIGESEILDTSRGKDLQALLKSGAKVGVSSRGFGSTITNEKGEEVVQDDYRLVTFDFVADPANPTSYPDVFYEDKEPDMTKENQKSDPAKLKEEFAQVAREVFAEGREALREAERVKLISDPSSGADKQVVENIASLLQGHLLPDDAKKAVSEREDQITQLKAELAEKDLKIEALQEQVDQLGEVAKEVAYRYFLEREIAGEAHVEMLRSFVGDPTQYESHEALGEAITEAKGELERQAQQVEETERKRQRELQIFEEDKQKLGFRADKLEEALDKATQLNNLLAIELYAERRLANHPRAEELRKVIESTEPESREDVDQIIESYEEPARDPEDLSKVRARVRAITSGGRSHTSAEEETGDTDGVEGVSESRDYNNLGIPLTELKKLAGV
jgi:hypothetical protein